MLNLQFKAIGLAALGLVFVIGGGIIFLTGQSVDSAQTDGEIRTQGLQFTLASQNVFAATSGDMLVITGVCKSSGGITTIRSNAQSGPAGLSGLSMPPGTQISLSRYSDTLTIIVKFPDRETRCNRDAQFVGKFAQEQRSGSPIIMENPTIAIGTEIRMDIANPTMDSWSEIPIAGRLSFPRELDSGESRIDGAGENVSGLVSGSYRFPAYSSETIRIFRGEKIELDLSDAILQDLSSEGDEIITTFSGFANQFDIHAGNSKRSALPNWLDWLYQSPLAAMLIILIGLIALLADTRSLVSTKK